MITQLLTSAVSNDKAGNKNDYNGTLITETIGNGFFIVDRKWTVKYWNRKAEKLLNVKANDIVGKNLWERFSAILPVNFYANYHKAFLKDIPVHFEEYWEELEAWFDVVTWHSDDSLFVSFKKSSYPVLTTQSGLQLKIMNDLYRFVTEVTNDCLWEWNLLTKELLWIDGGHKRVFGYAIDNSIISQSFWEECLHPEDRARVLSTLNRVITEGSAIMWEDEYRFKKAVGGYAYVHDRGRIIYEDGIASRMVGATQDITDRVLLENKLSLERQTRQREITHAVLTAQENERREIGEELHDNLGQILAVAKLYIQMAKRYHGKKRLYLNKSNDLLGSVILEIKKIAKKLVIPDSNIIGLFDNIKNLVHDVAVIHPIRIEFNVEAISEADMNEKMRLTVFRIVQEQVNNILKHANATDATIKLSREENEMTLLISDNGKGCDISKETDGVGIINIRSRAHLYYGNVTIASTPGTGFELKVVLPLVAAQRAS